MSGFIYRFDFAINDFINEHLVSPVLDVIFSIITHLGDAGLFWIALTVLLLCFKSTRRAGVSMAISLIFSLLVTNLFLKPLVDRPRPYALKAIDLRITPPSDPSFPSGHTSASFSAALALFWHDKKKGTPALVLAVLIGFSRLYFYLHFFTDVLAGSLVGFLASIAAYSLTPLVFRGVEKLKNARKKT